MNFEIPKDLVLNILNYLVEKPYGEVFGIISELQQLKAIKDGKAEDGGDNG